MKDELKIIQQTLNFINEYDLKEILVSGYIASVLKDAFEFNSPSITEIDLIDENDIYHLFGHVNGCKLFVDHHNLDGMIIKSLDGNKVQKIIL